jgi:serine/threonine-protein kinase HSL1 (negative regulator of Swe1 kinase)
VKTGEYIIPPELSYEAADLIQRILQKKPEDRISMQGMWMHPLLRKYEKLHQAMSTHPVGPPPPVSIQDCGALVTSQQDIDVDLLRNLQTLWHDARPETLVEKLLSKE